MKLTNNFNNLVNEIREQDIEVIDLMNMQTYAHKGYQYVFTAIDLFSSLRRVLPR